MPDSVADDTLSTLIIAVRDAKRPDPLDPDGTGWEYAERLQAGAERFRSWAERFVQGDEELWYSYRHAEGVVLVTGDTATVRDLRDRLSADRIIPRALPEIEAVGLVPADNRLLIAQAEREATDPSSWLRGV